MKRAIGLEKVGRVFITICCLGLLLPSVSFAQEAGKFRVGLEPGYLFPLKSGFGFSEAIELKYNMKNNMNIGLKQENAIMVDVEASDVRINLFAATYDYYLHSTGNRFSYFVGAGLGYYYCKIWGTDSYDGTELNSTFNNPTYLIRIGFEFWKLRSSLTYNLVRNPNYEIPRDRNTDYISFNIGFYIGGGKWKNEQLKLKIKFKKSTT